MNIKTKFSHVETLVNEGRWINGYAPTVSASTAVLYFNGDGCEVSIKLREYCELYDELGMFAQENKGEFIFNITGKPVNNHYENTINQLKIESTNISIDNKKMGEANTDLFAYNMKLQRYIDKMESKWWYKLFTWSW